MLVDAGTGIESEDLWEIKCVDEAKLDWQSVDLVLRTITQRRAALDAEEARWLRQAEAMRIWRPLGRRAATTDVLKPDARRRRTFSNLSSEENASRDGALLAAGDDGRSSHLHAALCGSQARRRARVGR